MHLWLRRFLVLIALMFWQGGFTFYAAIVVPIGQKALGPLEQGLLTRQVTNYLNLAGLAAIAIFVYEIAVARDDCRRRRAGRWTLVVVIAALLLALAGLHLRLDGLLDLDAARVLDRNAFRRGHRIYLWLSTVQWGCSVALAALTLSSWRGEDRRGLEMVPDDLRAHKKSCC